jgi:transcriptional regulator with XRE-family HTH domain
MLVQKLRLKKGWSQQQLAELSGLSARTIQRLEAGQPASTETLKSLAAVFDVDFSILQPEPDMNIPTPASAVSTMTPSAPMARPPEPFNAQQVDRQEAEAFEYVRRLKKFYMHLMRYVVICSLILVVNLIVNPHRLFALGVIGGWGIGILIHAMRVFQPRGFLGPRWEREQVERRLGRPL